jgi:hypothetical protein
MAKRKTVTHLPAAPPPAPQLATQLFTVTAEIFVVIVIGVGLLTVAGWLLDRERGVYSQPPVHLHFRDIP